jgi:hypothetical protein
MIQICKATFLTRRANKVWTRYWYFKWKRKFLLLKYMSSRHPFAYRLYIICYYPLFICDLFNYSQIPFQKKIVLSNADLCHCMKNSFNIIPKCIFAVSIYIKTEFVSRNSFLNFWSSKNGLRGGTWKNPEKGPKNPLSHNFWWEIARFLFWNFFRF